MSIIRADAWQNAAGTQEFYKCRAWVNLNGTLAAASMIRASGNVTSITDNGIGDYTINFTVAMPDVNYSVVFGSTSILQTNGHAWGLLQIVSQTVSAVRVSMPSIASDPTVVCVSIFR